MVTMHLSAQRQILLEDEIVCKREKNSQRKNIITCKLLCKYNNFYYFVRDLTVNWRIDYTEKYFSIVCSVNI